MSFYRKKKKILLLLIGLVAVFFINYPLIYVVISSFKPEIEFMMSANVIPETFTLENYKQLATSTPFLRFVKNSFIISATTSVLAIIIASLAGYILSRWKAKVLSAYGTVLLILQMFPLVIILLPLFLIFNSLNILNTHFTVILIYITTTQPFTVWIFKGFYDSIPISIEESAVIDGASRFQIYSKIVLPLTIPGMIAVAMFAFVVSWNDFLISSVFLTKANMFTVPVGIQMFMQESTDQPSMIMTAGTVAMLPTLILFAFLQKYFVSGTVAGAVKG